jgi:uncharacterized membrane protein
MQFYLRGIPIALLMLLGTGTNAFADFRICNRSLVYVDVSFGWNDPRSGWTSQGWWNLPVGSCQTVWKGNLTNKVYYLYAKGEGRYWGASDTNTGGAFCTRSMVKYIAHNRDYESAKGVINCEAAGFQTIRFRRIDTGGTDYTYNLTSRSDDPLQKPVITSTTPAPAPQSTQPPPTGTACQRYPNLC